MDIALLILLTLQATCEVGQQHPAQFEHESGLEQFSQDVSMQPQVGHDEIPKAMGNDELYPSARWQNTFFAQAVRCQPTLKGDPNLVWKVEPTLD